MRFKHVYTSADNVATMKKDPNAWHQHAIDVKGNNDAFDKYCVK